MKFKTVYLDLLAVFIGSLLAILAQESLQVFSVLKTKKRKRKFKMSTEVTGTPVEKPEDETKVEKSEGEIKVQEQQQGGEASEAQKKEEVGAEVQKQESAAESGKITEEEQE